MQAVEHAAGGGRVERGSGLVGQNHARVGCERTGNAHALLLPAGKLGGVVLRAVGQADNLQTFAHALVDFVFAPAGNFQREGHVAGHSAVGKQVELLKHHADVLTGGAQLGGIHGGEVLAVNQYFAAVGAFQQVDQAQQGGFARAGIAHQPEYFALVDAQAQGMHGHELVAFAVMIAFTNGIQNNHDVVVWPPHSAAAKI